MSVQRQQIRSMQVEWQKCAGNVWGPLLTVDTSHSHFDNMEGLYIIWHSGQNPHVVRVGQGVIRDRILAHRGDPQIFRYCDQGLFITWARVGTQFRDGVERYLAELLSPLVGDRYPSVPSIAVNLPWQVPHWTMGVEARLLVHEV